MQVYTENLRNRQSGAWRQLARLREVRRRELSEDVCWGGGGCLLSVELNLGVAWKNV